MAGGAGPRENLVENFGNLPLLSDKLKSINSHISYGPSTGSEIQPKAPLFRSRTEAVTDKVGFSAKK